MVYLHLLYYIINYAYTTWGTKLKTSIFLSQTSNFKVFSLSGLSKICQTEKLAPFKPYVHWDFENYQ